jgi:hypothetical protein
VISGIISGESSWNALSNGQSVTVVWHMGNEKGERYGLIVQEVDFCAVGYLVRTCWDGRGCCDW